MPSPQFKVFIAAMCTGMACAVFAQALPDGCAEARSLGPVAPRVPDSAAPFPVHQLEMRTPLPPAVLPSGGRKYLIYELHLQNFGGQPLTVDAIDVSAGQRTIARFDHAGLQAVMPAGRRLDAGQAAVAFLCLAFEQGMPVPRQLRHSVTADGTRLGGGALTVDHAPLPVLGRPVTGGGWNPRNGPHAGSHHRMGILVFDGVASIARRFAHDWRKSRDGAPFAGDARELRSYHAYAEQVLAVADGVVVFARDGYPDNIPKTEAGFETAVPITIESIAGNTVMLDIGKGRFASYSHLQPGSVRVRPGQRVRRGQPLGRVGNSGDARWPHLHFQVTAAPSILAAEGLPFLFERYRLDSGNGAPQLRTRDFPWGDGALVDFGPD